MGRNWKRWFGLIAVVFLAAVVSSCGGNSTAIGVTVSAAGSSLTSANSSPTSQLSVLKGDTEVFSATVTGGSATTVYWQICLPVPLTNPPTQPAMCTPVPGVKTNNASTAVTGYGTITQNGLYTAPTTLPQTNSFEVVATSTVDLTAFGAIYVRIDSGIRVQMIPRTATIGTQETYSVTANVTGTTNTAVTWSVNNIANGNTTVGTIVPTGSETALYTAPTTALTASVVATSSADPAQSGTSTITVSAATNPTLASIDPTTAERGSAQQDLYLTGTNFFSTSTVLVNGTSVPTTWISTTLMRATIPATSLCFQAATAGCGLAQVVTLPIEIQQQNGDLSGSLPLSVTTVRPSVVASSPDSVPAMGAGLGLSLTGGFFAGGVTSATFNGFPGTGTGVSAGTTFTSSRQAIANVPAGGLSTPGLYPLVLQNSGVTTGSSTSAINIAVTPAAGTLLTSPSGTIAVGSSPSAIAVDQADGLAVVANTKSNTVSIISLASNTVVQTLGVGNAPTGVAIDDGLLAPLDPIAVVVNSSDNTLSTIDLKTNVVSPPISLPALPPPQAGQPSPPPYSIGINPATHRGVIAIQSTNLAIIFDVSSGRPTPPPGETAFPQIGGTNTNYGTGPQPQISVDPRLNWALITAGAGGIGNVNLVDLGRDAVAGVDPGRPASIVGTLFLSTAGEGVAGLGVNPETHQALLTTPSQGNFSTFSLLDQSVSTIPFTNQGIVVNELGYVAAAVSALPNIGVAVNTNGNTAAILDLENHLVIENVGLPAGSNPVAVAIDPSTNQALVVNPGTNTVSVLNLGAVRSNASPPAPQITLSSPEIAFTSTNQLMLTVNGGGFASGAQVFLDTTPLATVSASSRQIVATVPASMLTSARRYSVYVENPAQSVISNIEDLTVIQAIPVGAQPYGVAIDADCDVAAVTNSGDDTVSIVALAANSAPSAKTCVSAGAIGTVGSPVAVGTTPQGIAIEPRLGLAVVANNGSNNASVVDITETNPPSTVALCGGTCTNVTGVAINGDDSNADVTDVTNTSLGQNGNLSGITLPSTGIPSSAAAGASSTVDLNPEAVTVDPYLDYLGVAIAGQGQASTVDIVDVMNHNTFPRPGGFDLPTGIVFDPVNQVFVVANSLLNSVGFVDPSTAIASFAQVGMNPTALDYNYQTSTLVTANNASSTMSIIDYLCPPTIVTNCPAPEVRSILALGGSPQFSVAIDPKLNLAVLADQNNNRVLLIPLP